MTRQPKYINKTVYDKNYYEKLARYNNLQGGSFIRMLLFITVFLFIAMQNFKTEGSHVLGIIYLCLGLALIPLFSFVLPKISAAKSYKKLMEETQQNGKTVTTEIRTKIASTGSDGSEEIHEFDQVIRMSRYQGMLHLLFRDRKKLCLDLSGFTNQDPEEVLAYLVEKTGIKVKNEDR